MSNDFEVPDIVPDLIDNQSYHAYDKQIVLRLCGGTFPHQDGFDWSIVDQFRIFNNRIVPYSNGVPVGPDLRIVTVMSGDETARIIKPNK